MEISFALCMNHAVILLFFSEGIEKASQVTHITVAQYILIHIVN